MRHIIVIGLLTALCLDPAARAQNDPPPTPPGGGGEMRPPAPLPQGGGGSGGFGGPMQQERELIPQFDLDGDHRLNAEERAAARAWLKTQPQQGRGPGGRGRRGGPGPETPEPAKPGPEVSPEDVAPLDAPLYEPLVLRTLFLEFENDDWEQELADFSRTDVEVPATLIADGKEYPGVGASFRGASSLFTVGAGYKRSLNLSLDYADPEQSLQGYKTLNLLNVHADPTFLHTVLYFHIARELGIPSPKANYVRLVINGESWGVYVNQQQFDRTMIAENFPSAQEGGGARWKAPGSPNGRAGLEYLGEEREPYEARYEMKAGGKKDWKALINLCRVLNETPIEELEAALVPILDIDGALRFLALENALVNGDGYWIRASDYCLFLDEAGMFHLLPYDANETLQPAGGMGGRGGPGGRGGGPDAPGVGGGAGGRGVGAGVEIDPLIGLDDATKPLRSRLLAVPALRQRYLQHVHAIARDWLDWNRLGPVIERYRALIAKEVEADTRKLSSLAAFEQAIVRTPAAPAAAEGPAGAPPEAGAAPGGRGPEGGRPRMTLRDFVEARRAYLLEHPEIKKLGTIASSDL